MTNTLLAIIALCKEPGGSLSGPTGLICCVRVTCIGGKGIT